MKSSLPTSRPTSDRLAVVLLILVAIISILFFPSFLPGQTLFSNDGPLGRLMSVCHRLPQRFTGCWQDLNAIGYREGSAVLNVTYGLMLLLGPVVCSKVYAPVALLVLGLGAWCFFRQLGLASLACILGALAAALNSAFFSAACWGVAAHPITAGMSYFALAALVNPSPHSRWLKAAVAGLATGIGVADGADIGAIFSVYVAAFVVYQSLVGGGSGLRKVADGFGRVAVVALLAGLVAAQSISVLVSTQMEGLADTQGEAKTRQERWEWATQWSLPKREALNLIIPGLFGYRMDTPAGGNYWGAVGRAPAWDRFFESGQQGQPPTGRLRFAGGGAYAGILVVLVAFWAALQGLRGQQSVFHSLNRSYLWFWGAAALVSLLLAFGRYAPFYRLLYQLPYISTIRNPTKFMYAVNWSIVVLFAYGVHGFSRCYLTAPGTSTLGLLQHLNRWWLQGSSFDRKWATGCFMALGASVLGWLIYRSRSLSLEGYLQTVGFNEEMANGIARFSFAEVGWYLLFLILAMGLMTGVLSGWFSGQRATLSGILMGMLLVADLGRANQPWIIYWNYNQKYASNPVIELLRDRPYEHRVAILPKWLAKVFHLPEPLCTREQHWEEVYDTEWSQHLFPNYDIQTLDLVQLSRVPGDLKAYTQALQFRGGKDSLYLITRLWQLTNTRFLLGASGFLDVLNRGIDFHQQRFRSVLRFELVPKPGIMRPTGLDQITVAPASDGPFALFEFTGALPRAKLYSNWQVITNDQATLENLIREDYDPARLLLVANPLPGAATNAANEIAGDVLYSSYTPKRIVLRAAAAAPSVLLLNDRFDPNWKVWVDGKSEMLLRCNYLMRGVKVPAGEHQIEFRFSPPFASLYLSLVATVLALLLTGILIFYKPKSVRKSAVAGTP